MELGRRLCEDEFRQQGWGKTVKGDRSCSLVAMNRIQSWPSSSFFPFLIAKGFKNNSAGCSSIKHLRSGQFLLHWATHKASKTLCRWDGKQFLERPIKVTAHWSFNLLPWLCRDIEGNTKSELASYVSNSCTVAPPQEREEICTNTLFLTFSLPWIPDFIEVGYLQVKVSLHSFSIALLQSVHSFSIALLQPSALWSRG